MSITREQALQMIETAISDSSNRPFVAACLDQAIREFARARRWPELMVRAFFNTEAAYETGTIAVTVDTATVTLTGGTFPTGVANHRIALSTSDPWHAITTRDSGTQVTLSENWIQDTVTASAYITYRSHYSLASNVDRVEEMWLHDQGRMVPLNNAATDQQVTEFLHYPSGPGVPTHWYAMERDSSGNHQILVGPQTPDDVYRVEYVYRKKATSLDDFDETRWPAILAKAKSLAYEPEFYERSQMEEAKYERLLDKEWANSGAAETQSVRVGQNRVVYPEHGDYMENLMGYGRVQDPS